MSRQIERLFEICHEATGVWPSALPLARREAAMFAISALPSLTHSPWANPADTRDKIEGVIKDIRRLKERISGLDGYSLSLARRSAPDVVAIDARFNAAIAAGEDPEQAAKEWVDARAPPPEFWVDFAAIRHLDSLEAGLAAVVLKAGEAAAWRAHGSGGRRPARAPYLVAMSAARIYRLLTGEAPGFWNAKAPPTAYGRMLKALFSELGIEADIRRPAEWANRPE